MAAHARHARHARTREPRGSALLRAGLVLSAAGAVAAAGGGVAAAAPTPPPTPKQRQQQEQARQQEKTQGTQERRRQGERRLSREEGAELAATELGKAVDGVFRPVKELQLNPLARTGVDPLDNTLGTQVADFRPVSTEALTGPLAEGGSLDDLPLVGAVADALPG